MYTSDEAKFFSETGYVIFINEYVEIKIFFNFNIILLSFKIKKKRLFEWAQEVDNIIYAPNHMAIHHVDPCAPLYCLENHAVSNKFCISGINEDSWFILNELQISPFFRAYYELVLVFLDWIIFLFLATDKRFGLMKTSALAKVTLARHSITLLCVLVETLK